MKIGAICVESMCVKRDNTNYSFNHHGRVYRILGLSFREKTERERERGHPANRSQSTATTLFMLLFLSITSLFKKQCFGMSGFEC